MSLRKQSCQVGCPVYDGGDKTCRKGHHQCHNHDIHQQRQYYRNSALFYPAVLRNAVGQRLSECRDKQGYDKRRQRTQQVLDHKQYNQSDCRPVAKAQQKVLVLFAICSNLQHPLSQKKRLLQLWP